MEKYDVVVIGGGSGGYPAAIRSAQLGARAALIEKNLLGGTCLNWGCIPTKTLLASSSAYQEIRHAGRLGINVGSVAADYAAMARRKDQVVEKLRGGVTQLLKAHGVDVYHGHAAFQSRRIALVELEGGEPVKLESDSFIIATGSVSAHPKFLPEHSAVIDSTGFLELESLPESMIVMGGGIIGCELACLAAQLDVKVTIVEMLDDVLMMLDRDVRTILRRHMEKNLKIRIVTGQRLEKVEVDVQSVNAEVGGEKIQAAMLLVAVGRVPYTKNLNLEAAGVETDERGFVPVDADCRTKAGNIFAVGDVNGGPQLAHAATAQGLRAAAAARAGSSGMRSAIAPSCIFTTPEIGVVGMTEQDAAAAEHRVMVGKFNFAALGKALAADVPTGFVKWVADADTGQVLGAQAVGAHATELIAEATLAVQSELTLREIAATIHAHPTMSEAWAEAAHAAEEQCIHAPPRRRK